MKGIDVSHYQGKIDFNRVCAAGYGFVLLKATEGTFYKDPTFEANYKMAKAAGLLVGAYHFGTFGSIQAAKSEAKWFKKVISGKPFDIIPQLDLEQNHAGSQLVISMQAFFDELGRCGLYSMGYFYLNNLAGHHTQPLWYSRFTSSPTGVKTYAIWQHTSQAKVPGIGGWVDENLIGLDWDNVLVAQPVRKVTQKTIQKVAAKPEIVKTNSMYVMANELNIRQDPSITSKLLGLLRHGDRVQVEGISGGWAKLSSAGKMVYVASDYLSDQNPLAAKPISKPATKPTNQIYHTIAVGDTVGKLAAHYHATINQIRSWNHLDSHYTIYLKQKIRVR